MIIAAVALWDRPFHSRPNSSQGRSSCEQSGIGDLCGAAIGLSNALHDPVFRASPPASLPPAEVSGATDPAITQINIGTTICRPGYSGSVRPSYAITGPLKRRLMEAQHPGASAADYELDHLIPISLGGAPLDQRDLWLQPRGGQANAGDKNVLAYVLWRLVCEGRVPLVTAQADISNDWIKAYQVYATPENVAKYHFRHRDAEAPN